MADADLTAVPEEGRADWPIARRDAVIAEVREFAKAYPGLDVMSMDYFDHGPGRLVMEVVAADEAAFDRDLRARFGTLPDVYFRRYAHEPQRLERWEIDDSDRVLTVWWRGGGSDVQLESDETNALVRLTAKVSVLVDARRSPTSVGPEVHFGDLGPFDLEHSASITLRQPLATRAIRDGSEDPPRKIPVRGGRNVGGAKRQAPR